jgi:hypothetical protein
MQNFCIDADATNIIVITVLSHTPKMVIVNIENMKCNFMFKKESNSIFFLKKKMARNKKKKKSIKQQFLFEPRTLETNAEHIVCMYLWRNGMC